MFIARNKLSITTNAIPATSAGLATGKAKLKNSLSLVAPRLAADSIIFNALF